MDQDRKPLWSISEVAEDCGVRRETIADIIKKRGIVTKPTLGRARGLDADDILVIKMALGMAEPVAA